MIERNKKAIKNTKNDEKELQDVKFLFEKINLNTFELLFQKFLKNRFYHNVFMQCMHGLGMYS